jgi:hypothetical protein
MRDELAAAVAGAVLVAVGVAMWSLAAGFVFGGLELVAGAYVAAYLRARSAVVRR